MYRSTRWTVWRFQSSQRRTWHVWVSLRLIKNWLIAKMETLWPMASMMIWWARWIKTDFARLVGAHKSTAPGISDTSNLVSQFTTATYSTMSVKFCGAFAAIARTCYRISQTMRSWTRSSSRRPHFAIRSLASMPCSNSRQISRLAQFARPTITSIRRERCVSSMKFWTTQLRRKCQRTIPSKFYGPSKPSTS